MSRRIPANWALALAGLAGTLVLAVELRSADQQTRNVTQALKAVEGQTLRLANIAGRLDLKPGEGPDVVVEATIVASGRDAAETRLLLDQMKWVEGNDSKGRREWALAYPVGKFDGFHYPRPGGKDEGTWLSWISSEWGSSNGEYLGHKVSVYGTKSTDHPTLYVDLTVRVPRNASLAYRDICGDIKGTDLVAKLDLSTGDGDVNLTSIAGSLTADTGSGDIDIGSLDGDGACDTGSGDVHIGKVHSSVLAIDTGSGDVHVADGTASKLTADTGSGDILVSRVEFEVFKGDTGSGDVTVESSLAGARDVAVDTGSGDVRILAGRDASFDIETDQGSGDLSVGYSDAILKKDGREIIGARRGDGKTRIRIDTGSGDCEIAPRS